MQADRTEQAFGHALTRFVTSLICEEVNASALGVLSTTIPDDADTRLNELGSSELEASRPVWGAGLRNPDVPAELSNRYTFFTLRGPLTRAALKLPKSVPIGAPCLLLKALYEPEPSPAFLSKIVCIPPCSDRREARDLLAISGADTILRTPTDGDDEAIRKFIDAISAASFVLTASLHGAIVSAAYGKAFCFWDSGSIESLFEWNDFAFSINANSVFARTAEEGRKLYIEFNGNIHLPKLLPLLRAAPIEVAASAFLKVINTDNPKLLNATQSEVQEMHRAIGHAREEAMRLRKKSNTALTQAEKWARAASVKREAVQQLMLDSRKCRGELGISSHLRFARRGQLRSVQASALAPPRSIKREIKEIENSGLFDSAWYVSQNPDVAASGAHPLSHFVKHGIQEERDPNPLFSCAWYRAHLPSGDHSARPFLHYVRGGFARLSEQPWSPHPLFNPRYYLDNNKDVADSGMDPLRHFLKYGDREHRDPHPLVSIEWLTANAGLEESDSPLLEYLTKPALFAYSPHPLFDSNFYLSENPDVVTASVNPLLHYCAVGWRQGRSPHPLFANDFYIANNPDMLPSGHDPLSHFVYQGWREGRWPHPLFNTSFYLRHNKYLEKLSYDPLSHYVIFGEQEALETTEKISRELILAVTPPDKIENHGLLEVFLQDDELSYPGKWLPGPLELYQSPPELVDHILYRYSSKPLDFYIYLMSVVDRYADVPKTFPDSDAFNTITYKLRHLAASVPRADKTKGLDVSIIVPVHNNFVFTLTCVLSILQNKTSFSYEIIIGDDLSTDATGDIFESVGDPIRLVSHAVNIGFLNNCNRCAEIAKGRIIVLLNNDTLTLPGWLDELMEPFDGGETIGLVGSKLLSGDGTLQEAGGIFWRDGTAWNFGRGDTARLPEYNYRKDVDYISGASIAVPLDLWRRLGGFDSEFNPAYCEDSDLAFRIRKAGLRTIYAPQSEVIHHEGKSHGRDTSSGIKAYQIINQEKLKARWGHVLAENNFNVGENVFLARDRSRSRPHILVVDHGVPQWDRDAGSRTMHHFLRMFVKAGFQISLWPDNRYEDVEYSAALQKMGIEVVYSIGQSINFDKWIAENGRYFQYVLLSRPQVAIKYYETIRASSECKVIYYGHDIHHRRLALEMMRNKSPKIALEFNELRMQEFANWLLADVVLYPSAEERDFVRNKLHDCTAAVVPMLGYNAEELAKARQNLLHFASRDFDEMLFVGSSHSPNVDALLWFARDILPLVIQKNPSTRLNVVGASLSAEIAALGGPSILIHGRLSDAELTNLYARCGVAVIPLRFGGGVKGKTVEALFNAIPIVTTPIGMQGLESDEPIALVAETAEGFAEAILDTQIRTDDARRRVERGVEFIERDYTVAAMELAFGPFIPELV